MPAALARTAQYAQVDKFLVERNSQRSIARVTGVAWMTVAKRIKKVQAQPPLLPRLRPKKAQCKRWETLELDEMWTFVGCKRRKVWLWVAVERVGRRIMAWVVDQRDAATARRLWQVLPRRYRYHCRYFTDLWESYVGVLSQWQHRCCPKGNGGTSIVEAINCSLR